MKVIEIFQSIDGEVNYWGQGTTATFIRFAGCNLACPYCDTYESRFEMNGKEMSIDEIISQVKTEKVTLTGGEPLIQDLDELTRLISLLIANGHSITMETNGSIRIPTKKWRQFRRTGFGLNLVVDYKLQYTDYMESFNWEDLMCHDFIKIPIESKEKFYKAVEVSKTLFHERMFIGRMAFSPVGIKPKVLYSWMVDNQLTDIALNVQLHKLLDLR